MNYYAITTAILCSISVVHLQISLTKQLYSCPFHLVAFYFFIYFWASLFLTHCSRAGRVAVSQGPGSNPELSGVSHVLPVSCGFLQGYFRFPLIAQIHAVKWIFCAKLPIGVNMCVQCALWWPSIPSRMYSYHATLRLAFPGEAPDRPWP